jgi:hypothetical protein
MVILAGQLIAGGVRSLTVTVKPQLAVRFAASVALQLTVVVPFGNCEPEVGEHTTVVTPEQLSVAVGL